MSRSRTERGMTPKAIRNGTLFALVLADFLAALFLVVKSVVFVVSPDPGVKAGPMYVTLALCTISALLMLTLALNASFLPILTRQRERDLRLVAWATGGTGVATGVLSVGAAAQPLVIALFIAAIAFVFIWIQEARIDRARRLGPPAGGGGRAPARGEKAGVAGTMGTYKSRQRRGGRKR
jgi:hypothetical protein